MLERLGGSVCRVRRKRPGCRPADPCVLILKLFDNHVRRRPQPPPRHFADAPLFTGPHAPPGARAAPGEAGRAEHPVSPPSRLDGRPRARDGRGGALARLLRKDSRREQSLFTPMCDNRSARSTIRCSLTTTASAHRCEQRGGSAPCEPIATSTRNAPQSLPPDSPRRMPPGSRSCGARSAPCRALRHRTHDCAPRVETRDGFSKHR